MSSISKTERLLQSMRTQAKALEQRTAASAQPASEAPAQARRRQVARHVLQRVREIGADDPQRRRRAMRVFLEGNVLALFGIEALADSQMQRMLDDVLQTMQADSQLATAVERAADRLLAGDASLAAELQAIWPPGG
jgi:uncharacterized protein with ATP-grasp and redox domains